MQENNFLVFKKSMRKHIFKTSNIFCIKKSIQNMLGYWPYATHKKTNFDIYVYLPQLRRKPGILNTRLVYIFYNIKKSDFKINIPENKSLSLSFFIKKNKQHVRPGHLPKQMTRLDTKTKGRSLLNETRQNACKETTLLFK
jgi:hypothetical protein